MLSVGFSFSQTDIVLNLNHHYEGAPFVYGSIYTTEAGVAIEFSRAQYYLSGFEIKHDGGTVTTMPDSYVLASGNVSSYNLGNENINTLEEINFDLGVDSLRNHMGISFWPPQHPLAVQAPPMDWAWPSGYFFWAFEGLIDDNGDGTPNKQFQLFGIGDTLLRDVTSFSSLNLTGNTLTVPLDVNIADWIKNMDLNIGGVEHGAGVRNTQLADNTNGETVFTMASTLNIDDLSNQESHIYANYEIPYAPTLFYNLATKNNVDIQIYDINGRLVLESLNQSFEGNYFIRKELQTGTYIAVFSNNELEESLRFVVQQ